MLRLLLLTLLLAVGCSHPVDSVGDKAEAATTKYCEDCAEGRGVTVTACLDFFNAFLWTEEERSCLKAVGDRHESAGPYYDCVNDRAGEYESCMDSAGCNQAAVENCGNILDSIGDTCPLPSGDALREIDACI